MILDKVNAYRTPGNDSIMVYFGPFGIWWEKYLGRGAEQEERGQTCLNLLSLIENKLMVTKGEASWGMSQIGDGN